MRTDLDRARGVAVGAVVVVVAGEDELRLPAVQERGGHVCAEHVDVLVPGARGQSWMTFARVAPTGPVSVYPNTGPIACV